MRRNGHSIVNTITKKNEKNIIIVPHYSFRLKCEQKESKFILITSHSIIIIILNIHFIWTFLFPLKSYSFYSSVLFIFSFNFILRSVVSSPLHSLFWSNKLKASDLATQSEHIRFGRKWILAWLRFCYASFPVDLNIF